MVLKKKMKPRRINFKMRIIFSHCFYAIFVLAIVDGLTVFRRTEMFNNTNNFLEEDYPSSNYTTDNISTSEPKKQLELFSNLNFSDNLNNKGIFEHINISETYLADHVSVNSFQDDINKYIIENNKPNLKNETTYSISNNSVNFSNKSITNVSTQNMSHFSNDSKSAASNNIVNINNRSTKNTLSQNMTNFLNDSKSAVLNNSVNFSNGNKNSISNQNISNDSKSAQFDIVLSGNATNEIILQVSSKRYNSPNSFMFENDVRLAKFVYKSESTGIDHTKSEFGETAASQQSQTSTSSDNIVYENSITSTNSINASRGIDTENHTTDETLTFAPEYQVHSQGVLSRRARFDEEEENNFELEGQESRRTGKVSRIPLIPNFPDTVRPIQEEPDNATYEQLNEFIAQMRSARVAGIRFTDNNNAEKCKTPDQKDGSCVSLLECKEVMDNWRRQTPTICQWNNDMPIVCCPDPTLSRKFEMPNCGTRVIKGLNLNRVKRQMPRMIPEMALHINKTKLPIIAGGKESSIGAWPWMAGVYTRNFGVENFLCGAAIINDRHLVTAAHCFKLSGGRNVQPTRYAVRVGSSNVREGTLYLIDSITIHPDYRPREHYNDIAVIRLKDRINFEPNVRPICLPSQPDIRRKKLQGRDVTVTGWGDQEFGGKSATVLREVTVQVVDVPACDESYRDNRGRSLPQGITRQFICAGTLEGGKDACSRDSGGPLMLLEKGVYYLVGVVSFGFQCARAGYPGVYTRVTSYLDWLDEVAPSS